MRVQNIVYFSTNLKLEDLDLSNQAQVLKYFEERIQDYYLKPIKVLVDNEMAFAAGALECLLIDALSRYATTVDVVNTRIKDWCQQNLKIDADTAKGFYDFFRCGLLHEAHIKEFGQFCFEDYYCPVAVAKVQKFVIVNPKHLLTAIEDYVKDFLLTLKSDPAIYSIFIGRLKVDFEEESKLAKS